jgi:hypothetical protein
MTVIDDFIAEIKAAPKFAAAAASNPTWIETVEGLKVALRGLSLLADDDVRALDMYDRATAIISSDAAVGQRVLAVHDILVEASWAFDPGAWGGRVAASTQ